MKKRPNIIVIKTDQQPFDTLSCLGHPQLKTPHLDALAGDGALLKEAFCVSPLCVPSRTSFFTGQYVHRTGAVRMTEKDHISPDQGCLLDVLRDSGYSLGICGKNHAFDEDYLRERFDCVEVFGHWGKTHGEIRAKDQEVIDWLKVDDRFERAPKYLGKMEGLIEGAMPFEIEDCPRSRIAEDGVAFVKAKVEENSPFFLHYSFPDPHWPNVVFEPYYSMYDPSEIELPAWEHEWEGKPFAHWTQSKVY